MTEVDEVYTGYNSYREKCENTCAFANDENIVLFFDAKEDMVQNIWLTLDTSKEDDIPTAINMLNALSQMGKYIIADWGWSYVKEIVNIAEIEKYLRKRLQVFTKGG